MAELGAEAKRLLSRLRLKLMAVIFVITVLLLAAIFAVIYMTEVKRVESESRRQLEFVIQNGTTLQRPIGVDPADWDPATAGALPALYVQLTPRGRIEIIQTSFNVENEAALRALVQLSLELPAAEGIISELNLRYLRDTDAQHNIRLAFVDRSAEKRQLAALRGNLTRVGVPALLGLGLLAWLLASIVLDPVRRAWLAESRFLEDASHELKTPLAVLSANLGLVRSHPERTVAEQDRWLEGMAVEIDSMTRLITNLLTLSRLESEKLDPKIAAPVDLSRVCERACLAFEALAHEGGQEIVADIETGLVVRGDAEELRQLLGILLENALRHGAPGRPVELHLVARGGRSLRLEVTNEGEPIPEHDLPHLFDRFYRAAAERSRSGFGLGLAIARGIVQRHRGQIWATSSVEAGTTFTVSLPRHGDVAPGAGGTAAGGL